MNYHQRIKIVGCRCKSPYCPHCGIAYWASVRAKIISHLHIFERPRLLTLTVDRKHFQSGYEAYLYIEKEKGLIRRFLRYLGFKKAFKVMAFHSASEKHPDGNDWPHWHIMIDLADCNGWVDLERGWRLWRDKWGIGGFDLPTERYFGSAAAAVRYCVSYMQHQSGVCPDWVLNAKRAPRCFEVYGELRRLVREDSQGNNESVTVEKDDLCEDKVVCEKELESVSGVESYDFETDIVNDLDDLELSRTVRVRLSECRHGSVLLVESDVGQSRFTKFAGTIPLPPGAFAFFIKASQPEGFSVEIEKYENGTEKITVYYEPGRRSVEDSIKQIESVSRDLISLRDGGNIGLLTG